MFHLSCRTISQEVLWPAETRTYVQIAPALTDTRCCRTAKTTGDKHTHLQTQSHSVTVLHIAVHCLALIHGLCLSLLSSLSHRLPPTSPSTLSIVGAGASSSSSSGERCRLTRGSTIRSTFHGGQLRDRVPPTYGPPPTSPTLSHDAGALPPNARSRATSNLFSKLTSKLTRR